MKKLIILILVTGVLTTIGGCKKDKQGPLTKSGTAPDPIQSPVVKNTPGGAIVTYTTPGNVDLLYVKAVYTITNGTKVETKSSLYSDTIFIKGYGDTNEHEVNLYAVNRSEQESPAVTVKIKPLVASHKSVLESMVLRPAFGGVQFTWKNPDNDPLAFIILAKDPATGKIVQQKTVYSGTTNGLFALRGFEPEMNVFGVVIRDRWDNYSDTIKQSLVPLFERKLDKKLFNKIILSGDADINAWGGKYEYMYDDDFSNGNMMHTYAGTGWPQYFTLDLGVTAQLSRFIVYQRMDFAYSHGNFKLFEIFGRDDKPTDGSWDGWIKLRDCVATRPSEEGGNPDEDAKHLTDGDEFSFDLEAPKVRYIRIRVNETWGKTGFIHASELTFFGQ